MCLAGAVRALVGSAILRGTVRGRLRMGVDASLPQGAAEPVEFQTSLPLQLVPAMWILAYGLGQLLTGALLGFERGLVGLALSLVVAVPVVIWGILRRRRVVLRVDTEGIHGASGDLLSDWSSVAVAWVGPAVVFTSLSSRYASWVGGGNSLIVWTDAAISFSRRTNFVPTAHVNVRLPTTASADEIAAAVRRFTDRPVYTPTTMKLKRLQRWLKDPDAVGDLV